jgi:hypothetical protein
MNHTNTGWHRHTLGALTLASCLALSSCTTVEKINVKPSPLGEAFGRERFPLHVALVLDEGFTNYTYRRPTIGTEVFPLGPSLAQYARHVCGTAFQSVTAVSNVQQVSGKEQCVLIPRVVGASFEQALSGLSEPEMVVIVEWTLKDRAAQTVLWLATVEGKSKEVMGTSFTYQKHKRIRYQKLFDDLSRNTAAAFANSPEIKHLVQPE